MGIGLNGFIFKKYYINEKKRSWELFRICLLSSTANPAQFGWKLGLAVLLSRQILISSQDHFFSYLDIIFFIFYFKIWNHWDLCPCIFHGFVYRWCDVFLSKIGFKIFRWYFTKLFPVAAERSFWSSQVKSVRLTASVARFLSWSWTLVMVTSAYI